MENSISSKLQQTSTKGIFFKKADDYIMSLPVAFNSANVVTCTGLFRTQLNTYDGAFFINL